MPRLVNTATGVEVIIDEALTEKLGPGWKPKAEPKRAEPRK